MTCKECENLILNEVDGTATEEEILTKDRHLKDCISCQKFYSDITAMQSLYSLNPLPLPSELDQLTLEKCREKLYSSSQTKQKWISHWRSVPLPIWSALIVIAVVTIAMAVPALNSLQLEGPLSSRVITSLFILLQNAVMLIISPLIISKFNKNKRRMVIKNV